MGKPKVAVSLLSITNQPTCNTNDRIVDSESELEWAWNGFDQIKEALGISDKQTLNSQS